MVHRSLPCPDLIILRTTDGGGYPYISTEGCPGLVVDLGKGTWCIPRRSSRLFPIGTCDGQVYGQRNEVLGVYRQDDQAHLRALLADAREAQWRASARHKAP